ncbi:hypothetical protein [Bradyrhizobium sp. URHA0013]|jgi:hypothetical protein|uniref:hypothetical protein n=1 Tax=Bradyrhizobium sp. URHA0013 TaxID=1380352 RepID=UPI0012DF124C|nr:hypothetical protein [Bradyrhizobium sp. URHA0013]
MYSSRSGYTVANSVLIPGLNEWILDHASTDWWSPFYINFMFERLPGSEEAVLAQMRKAIEKYYGRSSTRFDRAPRSAHSQSRIPRLLLFPDKPVAKREMASLREVSMNAGGLHYNGPMMIPRYSRFRGCVIDHLEQKQQAYTLHGIRRIHVKPIHGAAGIAEYACKTIKRNRADQDAILALPRSMSELPDRD